LWAIAQPFWLLSLYSGGIFVGNQRTDLSTFALTIAAIGLYLAFNHNALSLSPATECMRAEAEKRIEGLRGRAFDNSTWGLIGLWTRDRLPAT